MTALLRSLLPNYKVTWTSVFYRLVTKVGISFTTSLGSRSNSGLPCNEENGMFDKPLYG